jgi:hypothetical protein
LTESQQDAKKDARILKTVYERYLRLRQRIIHKQKHRIPLKIYELEYCIALDALPDTVTVKDMARRDVASGNLRLYIRRKEIQSKPRKTKLLIQRDVIKEPESIDSSAERLLKSYRLSDKLTRAKLEKQALEANVKTETGKYTPKPYVEVYDGKAYLPAPSCIVIGVYDSLGHEVVWLPKPKRKIDPSAYSF